jgi:hypothetical protein
MTFGINLFNYAPFLNIRKKIITYDFNLWITIENGAAFVSNGFPF